MAPQYQIICMSFDGEYKKERPTFTDIDDAWDYANDLGSKWYFYPFYFIVSKRTIRAAPNPLGYFTGKRIKTVSRIFKETSEEPDTENMNAEAYALYLFYKLT